MEVDGKDSSCFSDVLHETGVAGNELMLGVVGRGWFGEGGGDSFGGFTVTGY